MEFSVGDLVQTRQATVRGLGRRKFTLPAAWLGIVLGVHPAGALRIRFNELSSLDKPCELWANPEDLARVSG